jgi:hypothetical protein
MRSYIHWVILSCIFLTCTPTRMAQNRAHYDIEELKKRTFAYFWEQAHPTNYQIPDRYPTLTFSSIAATGFGLSAYIVGIENGYISRSEGAQRVAHTLQTLWHLKQSNATNGISGYKGFFYHFLTLDGAERFKNVELSTIDTGLLMAGILSCMTYFDRDNVVESEIRIAANNLYTRVEWSWMMQPNGKMSMGWHPETGFIKSDWAGYNEAMILLLMAMGSPTHPIGDDAWEKWCESYPVDRYMGQEHVQFDPLFGHQYSHVWIDFRGIYDVKMKSLGYDYFENSRRATLSNRQYCIENPSKYIGYGPNLWGLTACDGPYQGTLSVDGQDRHFYDYRARGAASIQVVDDGTIAPTAAGGSYPFTPDLSGKCLQNMWNTYYIHLVGPYGFKDAFNLTYKTEKHPDGWFDIDYLGIDQGPILLQIDNHQHQTLWNIMKKNPYIIRGLKRAGFSGGWLDPHSK